MAIECDVLVVGAGPAGSAAARAAALGGAKTIFIDKKGEIGTFIQCAESISKYLIPYLPFKIPKEQLLWRTEGVSFWTEEVSIERTGPHWEGYNIDRRNFDKWLANIAVESGAKLLTGTELVELDFDNEHNVKKAVIRTFKKKREIKPKILIAADGVDSPTIGLLGLKDIKKGDIGEVVSYDIENIKIDNPHYDQIFFGEFAPGGYAYIFPNYKTKGSVGIAGTLDVHKFDDYFEEFIEHEVVKHQLRGGTLLDEKSGEIPMKYKTESWSYGNVMIAGDAANQNIKPFVEGILPAIICGDIAGDLAYRNIVSKMSLDNYRERVYNRLGHILETSDERIDIMHKLPHDIKDRRINLLYLGLFSEFFSVDDIKSLKNEEYKNILDILKRIENVKSEIK